MATKKLGEDMEEVKKSLNFMSEELSKVAKQQMGLLKLFEEVKQLKAVIKEKDKKIEELESTTQRTYARITAGDK